MKTLITLMAVTFLGFTSLVMAEGKPESAQSSVSPIHVSVNGLVCDFCARALDKMFSKQDAVSDIHVDLDKKVVTINVKKDQDLDDKTITKLITDSGYNVEGIHRGN